MSILTRILAVILLAVLMPGGPLAAQERYATPEAAADALYQAAKEPREGVFKAIFGEEGVTLLSSGDPETDRANLDRFLSLAETGRMIADGPDGTKRLVFGPGGWEFPVPLRQADGAWLFDIEAGRQEIINRTIGRNELRAIAACAAYVDAQREYFSALRDGEPVQQYARRLISRPGRQDGLWWPSTGPDDRSPLGDRITETIEASGYKPARYRTFKGYNYRILYRQGPNAPGGAYSYLVKGRMLAGFALIAYPEVWDETGAMTFLCGPDGQVYERNLGPRTAVLADRITAFDPGPGWQRVER